MLIYLLLLLLLVLSLSYFTMAFISCCDMKMEQLHVSSSLASGKTRSVKQKEREWRIITLFGQMISSHGMIKADMVIYFLFTFVIGLLESLNLNGTRQPQQLS
jgi:hypothetical protein